MANQQPPTAAKPATPKSNVPAKPEPTRRAAPPSDPEADDAAGDEVGGGLLAKDRR
jgi:hypothetical protein